MIPHFIKRYYSKSYRKVNAALGSMDWGTFGLGDVIQNVQNSGTGMKNKEHKARTRCEERGARNKETGPRNEETGFGIQEQEQGNRNRESRSW